MSHAADRGYAGFTHELVHKLEAAAVALRAAQAAVDELRDKRVQ
jgi:hypothetical protein